MFWILTLLALLLSLAGGAVFVAQIDQPLFMAPLVRRLQSIDLELPITIASIALPALVIFLAYVASFRKARRRRPIVGLFLLGASVGALVAALIVTSFGADEFIKPPYIPAIALGAGALLIGFIPRLIEIVIGRAARRAGNALLRAERCGSAARMLSLARRLLPGDESLVTKHGLALYEIGETEQALSALVEAYRRGERDPRIVRALADASNQLPEDLAVDALTEMLKIKPNDVRFGRRLVEMHLRRRRPADALPILERFYDPKVIEDICLLARLNAEEGRIDRAFELTRSAVELEGPPFKRSLSDMQVLAMQAPENTDVLRTLAELNEQAGNREEAISWYMNLLEVNEADVAARREVIRLYRQMGRTNDAIPHYRELLRKSPGQSDLALEYGQILEDAGDYEKAMDIFERAGEVAPNDHRFDYHIAVCLHALNRLDEAAQALEAARAKAPATERARIQPLAARIQTARIERELHELRDQAHAPEATLDTKLNHIQRLLDFQKPEEATRELDMLLHESPEEREQIKAFLERMIERGSPQFLVLSVLADIYLKDRHFDRVHELYNAMSKQSLHPDEVLADGCKKILRHNPGHLPSLKSQAELYIRGGHYREAAGALAKILELSPPAREELLPMLFEVYYQVGDAQRAIAYGEDLLKADSHNLNLYLRLREMMVKRDDYQGAMRVLRRALEVAPGNRQLREMLEESEVALKTSRMSLLLAQIEASPEQAQLLRELGDLYLEFDRLNDAITAYQRAAQNAEGDVRNLCLVKLAHCLARRQMFDLADETIAETDLREKQSEYMDAIKGYLYEVGQMFEMDEQFLRALNIYKRIFRLDAGYRDIVEKIEMLSHLK